MSPISTASIIRMNRQTRSSTDVLYLATFSLVMCLGSESVCSLSARTSSEWAGYLWCNLFWVASLSSACRGHCWDTKEGPYTLNLIPQFCLPDTRFMERHIFLSVIQIIASIQQLKQMAAAVLIGNVKTDICVPLINASFSCCCCPHRLRWEISSQTVAKAPFILAQVLIQPQHPVELPQTIVLCSGACHSFH